MWTGNVRAIWLSNRLPGLPGPGDPGLPVVSPLHNNTHTATRRTIPPHTSVQDPRRQDARRGAEGACGRQCWTHALLELAVDDHKSSISCCLCLDRTLLCLGGRGTSAKHTHTSNIYDGAARAGLAVCGRSGASVCLALLLPVLASGRRPASLRNGHGCIHNRQLFQPNIRLRLACVLAAERAAAPS